MKIQKVNSKKIQIVICFIIIFNLIVLEQIPNRIAIETNSLTYEYVPENSDEYKILNVPYENMVYDPFYGDAAACISMLTGYYGDKVSKIEINPIVAADYPSGGISEEGFLRAATYDGYSNKDFGFGAKIVSLKGKSYSEKWNFIKSYIDSNIPLIIITSLTPTSPTHHRVIIGYDERTEVLFVHDPWTLTNTPVYQGAKSPMSIEEGEWLGNTWQNNDYKIAIVRPIKVTLSFESLPITTEGDYLLQCSIYNGFIGSNQDLRLELTLPSGYSLLNGSTDLSINNFIGSVNRYWNIACPEPEIDDCITAKVYSVNEDISYGGIDNLYISHPKEIITNISSDCANDIVPCKTNITIELDCTGDVDASLHCFSTGPNEEGDGFNTTYNEFSSESFTEIKCITGPNAPGKLVFCWYNLSTDYGDILSPIIVLHTIDADSDGDGINDYEEETVYGTDMFSADTDEDGLNDYEEIFTYGTDPNNKDTDGDWMNDYDEIINGYDPLDSKSNNFKRFFVPIISSILPIIIIVPLTTYFIIKRRKLKKGDSISTSIDK